MLDPTWTKARQDRLRALMEAQHLDILYLSDVRDIYYATGQLLTVPDPAAQLPGASSRSTADGSSWLVSHTMEGDALVTQRFAYEPAHAATMNPDPHDPAQSRSWLPWSPVGTSRSGSASSRNRSPGSCRTPSPASSAPVRGSRSIPSSRSMQAIKDPDELELMRGAIGCSAAAYAAARALIAPGVNELDVREAGHRAAVLAARARSSSTMATTAPVCPVASPATARSKRASCTSSMPGPAIAATGPISAAYSPSPSRPRCNGKSSTWIADVLIGVQNEIRPGVDGTEIWTWLDARLREHPHLRELGLRGHGGHSIGTRAHEQPDINKERGGLIQAGMVLCVEPSGYSPELNAGIRLENQFLVTESGAELLSDIPLTL